MTLDNFSWGRSGALVQPDGSSVEIFTATRGTWTAGNIKVMQSSGIPVYYFEFNFSSPVNSTYVLSGGSLDGAMQYFNVIFNEFLARVKLRPVHAPIELVWRTKNDRHYLVGGNMLLAILYENMGAWVFDNFLTYTVVDGESVAEYREKGIDPLTRYDTDTPDNARQVGSIRNMPLCPKDQRDLNWCKNKVVWMITAWLMQSPFMLRPDPNFLPVGPEQ